MAYAVDILLLVTFFTMIAVGVTKGFVKSVLGMVAMIAAFAIAYQLSAVLAPVIYDRFISQRVFETINEKLVDASGAGAAARQTAAVFAAIPEAVLSMAASIGIDTGGILQKVSALDNQGANIATELEQSIAAPIITAVAHAILFIIVLVLSYILLMVVVKLIDKFFKLPLLKTANRLLGGVLGAFKGVIVVFLLCVILEVVAGWGKDSFTGDAVASSKIIAFLSENNFILNNFQI